MKPLFTFLLLAAATAIGAEPKRVVVCTVTTGFRHSSIPYAEKTLQQLAEESKAYTVVEWVQQPEVTVPKKPQKPRDLKADADEKAKERYAKELKKFEDEMAKWTPEQEAELKAAQAKLDEGVKQSLQKLDPKHLRELKVDGVIFANTTGDLPLPDKEGFIQWIEEGHAFMGMHSSSDTFHQFPPYRGMLGAEFETHKAQVGVDLYNADAKHPATAGIAAPWKLVQEEMYLFKNHDRANVHAVWYLKHHPNDPAVVGYHGVSWVKMAGKGRVFYTSLGHREDLWSADPALKDRKNPVETSKQYQQHILGGIKWALGLEQGEAAPNPQATEVEGATAPAAAAAATDAEGFKPLFNGKDFAGWHVRKPQAKNAWKVQDGALVNDLPKGEHGVDLITDEKFWNFTVRYEFKVPDGSNSGFYLRGRHEIQVLGDFASGKPAEKGSGSIYGFKAPSEFASKPGNEWQTVEATVIGNKISVTLNGKQIHREVECTKATGSELDKNIDQPGAFFLQGDHGAVAFRNLRVKVLPN